MGNRTTKLSKGTSTLSLAARDKYVSAMSLNMYASDWNLVVRDSFKPESVGLPSRDPQTRYIGPSSHLATCDLITRPEATSRRMKQLCGPSSPAVSPPTQSPARKVTEPGAARFTPTSQLSPQSSLDEENEESEQIIQHRYSYSIISTSAVLAEEDEGSTSHAVSKSLLHQNDDQDSDDLSEGVRQNEGADEKKGDDEVYISTTKSLTGSELATLDFLEQALIQEEELDSLVPNLDCPTVEEKSITYPVSENDIFSPAYNQALSSSPYNNVHRDDVVKLTAKVNLVNQQELSSSSTDTKTPGAANTQKSGNFFLASSKPTSDTVDQKSALLLNGSTVHNGIGSSKPEIVHPIFVPQTPPVPPPVKIPQPDYDDPPNVVGSINGVTTNGSAVFDSPETSTSFNVPTVEIYQMKSPKQVAYVRPHMKGLSDGRSELENRSTQNSPQKKKKSGGLSKSPGNVNTQGQRPVSVAVTSNLSQYNNNLIQEIETTQYAQDDIGTDSSTAALNVKNMVRRFESITPIGIATGATPPRQPAPTSPRLQSWVR